MTEYKQAIIIRQDLDMSIGKIISQSCHASLKAYKDTSENIKSEWERQGQKKIALEPGDYTLQELKSKAERENISTALIKDAGHTEVEPGQITALAIGPDKKHKIDKITGELKLIN